MVSALLASSLSALGRKRSVESTITRRNSAYRELLPHDDVDLLIRKLLVMRTPGAKHRRTRR